MPHSVVQYICFCLLMFFVKSLIAAEQKTMMTQTEWRKAIVATRQLAENNPKQALIDAKELLVNQPKPSIPTIHIDILNVIARAEIYLGKIEESERHANLALKLAELESYTTGQIEAHLNRTLITVNQGDIRATTVAAEKSLQLLDGVDRPDLLAEAMLRMMSANYRRGWLDEAVTLGLQNLEIANQNQNQWALLHASHGLAVINHYNGHYDDAFEYFGNMQKYALQVPSQLWSGHALLGQAYAASEQLKSGEKQSQEIETLFKEAIDVFKTAHFPFSLLTSLTGYATFLYQQQRYLDAEKMLFEALRLVKQNKTPIPQWYVLNEYSKVLEKLGRHKKMLAITKQAYDLAKKIEYPFYSAQSAANLARHLSKGKSFELAYQYMLESHLINNQLSQERANRNVSDLTERYKQESKQKQIDKLQIEAERHEADLQKKELQQRLLWTVLAASSVVILLSVYFIWRLRSSNRLLSQSNQNVQLSQAKLQAVVDALPDSLFVLDEQGTFLEVHSPVFEKNLGMNLGELEGQNISVLLPEQVVKKLTSQLQRLPHSEVSLIEEIELDFIDGQHWFELSVVREKWVTEGFEQFVVLARDISDRKRMEAIKQQNEQELEHAYQALRELTERREEAIEEERKRIARDIHDELGQYLTGLKMRISLLRMQPGLSQQQLSLQIRTMLTMINDIIAVVRKLASRIRPVQLDVGINAAIESLVDEFIKQTSLRCNFESDCADEEMSEAIAIVVFRLLQESLTNIRRHAKAESVSVKLLQNEQEYQLEICDDGIGFDTNNLKPGHFGLLGMRERVNNLGGTIALESILGVGTTIIVLIPKQKKGMKDD